MRRASRRVPRSSTHPRVCGEHRCIRFTKDWGYDSSPRVRGALDRTNPQAGQRRLIPACAGSTIMTVSMSDFVATHPRVCGEHPGWYPSAARIIDSSPRVRGAHPRIERRAGTVRLIPACAGSTDPLAAVGGWKATHPRVCGEHSASHGSRLGQRDSSPRVRGAHKEGDGLRFMIRLIPACAGSTRLAPNMRSDRPTHPRVCGEHHSPIPTPTTPADSSPRVRGARKRSTVSLGLIRLIPACAGSTL